jgi:hypothetical protein
MKIEWANSDSRITISLDSPVVGPSEVEFITVYENIDGVDEVSIVVSKAELIKFMKTAIKVLSND